MKKKSDVEAFFLLYRQCRPLGQYLSLNHKNTSLLAAGAFISNKRFFHGKIPPVNVYIETYGCQMNKLDSETVSAILAADGFRIVENMTDADVILLNTCGVRENAETRIHGRVGELSSLRAGRPGLVFGIIGCMAQRLDRKLLSKVVRIVAGPDSYRRLPDMLREAVYGPVVDTLLDTGETYDDIEPVRSDGFSAWVAVTRGCDNFCSYCIVPYTRGRERSMPVAHIVEEVEKLRDGGFREVTLLGQNVNSYRHEGVDFAGLLARVSDTGIGWVRFLTSHPADLTQGILDVMAGRDNVCSHLHLPIQSGSDRILEAMRRRYTSADYQKLVDDARHTVDGLSMTTDMIFGFPGETDDDFRASIDMMRRVRYDYAFLYRYSEREGTKAVGLPGSVPEEVRIERLKEAIALQLDITKERHEEQIGTTHRVLVKSPSKEAGGWFGFSEKSIPVVIAGTEGLAAGDFVDVVITGTTGASLIGSPAHKESCG